MLAVGREGWGRLKKSTLLCVEEIGFVSQIFYDDIEKQSVLTPVSRLPHRIRRTGIAKQTSDPRVLGHRLGEGEAAVEVFDGRRIIG
jgi:hypothetical protein